MAFSPFSIFGASSASDLQLFQLDTELLGAYYNARVGQALASRSNLVRAVDRFGPDVIPPWELTPPGEDGAAARLLSPKALIDLNDPALNRDGIDAETKSLFAVYQGLRKMQELARHAASDPNAGGLATILQSQWARYEGELQDYIGGLKFDDITLLAGSKLSSVAATALSPRARAAFSGSMLFADPDAAIATIDPDAEFTINIGKTDGTDFDVVIDLSQMGATTRSLNNIVDFINQELDAQGALTNVVVGPDANGVYGIVVERSLSETVTFSAALPEAALYMVATSGTGANAAGIVQKIDGLDGTPNVANTERVDPEGGAADARSVALDSEGHVLVVGKLSGDSDGQINQASEDLYLKKYDGAGTLLWSRLLGATDSAAGFAVTVDSNDNVIVAGKVRGELYDTATGGGVDGFVSKFDASGQELWTHQAAASATDGVLGLAVDASDNVYFTGYTQSALSGQTHGGGADAYLTKLDADGTRLAIQQFGGAGDQVGNALTVSGGQVYVVGRADGQAFVRRFDESTLVEDTGFQITLGDGAETTEATAIAIDGSGQIFIAGHTTDANLPNYSGAGRIAHQGGRDAFVARIDSGTGAVDFTSYIGSAGDDRAYGIDVNGTDIYLTGSTTGGLFGAPLVGSRDAFVVKLDATGVEQFTHQLAGAGGYASGAGIRVDAGGSSILTRLGLPHGALPVANSSSVTSNSTVRPGQFFYISVNDGPNVKISIRAEDSFRWLSFQINDALEGLGSAKVNFHSSGLDELEITALRGTKVTFHAGADGEDALAGLGLKPMDLYGEPPKGAEADADEKDETIFALGFLGQMNLLDKASAKTAAEHIDSAISKIQKAYRTITGQLLDKDERDRTLALLGQAPAYLQKQLAAYQDALARLSQGF